MTDVEFIEEISHGNANVLEDFFDVCKNFFMPSYSKIFKRKDIKEDVFQQSFVKLWTEIENGTVVIAYGYLQGISVWL